MTKRWTYIIAFAPDAQRSKFVPALMGYSFAHSPPEPLTRAEFVQTNHDALAVQFGQPSSAIKPSDVRVWMAEWNGTSWEHIGTLKLTDSAAFAALRDAG